MPRGHRPSGPEVTGHRSPPSIGVDVGGTKMLGVALSAGAEVVAEHRVPTPREGLEVVAALAELVGRLRADVGAVTAVGVGLPGLVDRSGVLRMAPNLPGVVDLPVARLLTAAAGVAVAVDNDATCALRAEHRSGAARNVGHAVLVTLGTGIGGGLLLDGRLARGARGFAGEIGHMVVEAGGRSCPCGRHGCWERYASGSALGSLGQEAARVGRSDRLTTLAGGRPTQVRGEHVTRAAQEGDPGAQAVLQVFADWLAVGLASLMHILDVEAFVIGGGLVAAGDVVLEPVRRAFQSRVVAPAHRPGVRIVAAELGERAGAIGAALLARESPISPRRAPR